MDRKTLICLAIGVGLLMLLVLSAGDSMSRKTRAWAQAELKNFERDKNEFAAKETRIQKQLAEHAKLFETNGVGTKWSEQLKVAAQSLQAAQQEVTTAKTLYDEGDAEKTAELTSVLNRIQNARLAAMGATTEIESTVTQWVDFEQNLDANIEKIEADLEAIRVLNIQEIDDDVNAAAVDWPDKKPDLLSRFEILSGNIGQAEETWKVIQQTRGPDGADTSAVEISKIITGAAVMKKLLMDLDSGVAELAALTDQLYWSWDKTLADMEIVDGRDVQFRHLYKTIKVRSTNDDKNARTEEIENWENVPKARYDAMENYLGMSVERKAAGKYDYEIERLPQPAGLSYMAPPEQERNRYGYWNRTPGGSFWVFYGQYSLMRNLLWGGSYRPVYADTYRGYETARQNNRTYFGRDSQGRQRFGTNSSGTTSGYRNSKYVRSGGYKNSTYIKSGRTYRGSKYTSSSRTRSSSYSSSSGRRSRSRSSFGGGRFGGK